MELLSAPWARWVSLHLGSWGQHCQQDLGYNKSYHPEMHPFATVSCSILASTEQGAAADGGRCYFSQLGSALARLQSECSVQDKKDTDILEWALKRITEMIRGLDPILMCKDKLREMGLFRLLKRKFKGLLSICANIWAGTLNGTEPAKWIQWKNKRELAQTEIWEIPLECKENF